MAALADFERFVVPFVEARQRRLWTTQSLMRLWSSARARACFACSWIP